jgi:hypothetical protein
LGSTGGNAQVGDAAPDRAAHRKIVTLQQGPLSA